MRKLLVIFLLVVFTYSYSQTTYYFNSNQTWNNTGYTYTAGSEVFVYPFGSHADNPNTDNWVETPAGKSFIPTSSHPLDYAPENGLIGKIGVNGTPFYIGAGGLMTLSNTESGALYLEVNDGDITNNVGQIFIHIFDKPTITYYFNSNQTWNNTGYSYTAGNEVYVYPFGSHADNPNTDNWVETPAGKSFIPTSGHPLDYAPENGLIGKIGVNGTPFYIGAGGLMTLSNTESGVLYLEVNDGDITNNVGQIFIHIFDGATLAISEEKGSIGTVSIFPNPSSNIISVVYPNPKKDEIYIRMTNVFGNTILYERYEDGHHDINVKNLKKGIYFVSIFKSSGELIQTKKVVVD